MESVKNTKQILTMKAKGETNLHELLKALKPKHQLGEFVFCAVNDGLEINSEDIIMSFREEEGKTVILKKELADRLNLPYAFVASWISLTVHSSLSAVGLTASFSKALAAEGISCNVVAAFYHDHLFVDKKDTEATMLILSQLSETE